MANKEILAVEIDDSAFSEFKRKFDEYEVAVKAMPEQWQKAGSEITTQKTHFEKMLKSVDGQNKTVAGALIYQEKFNKLLDASSLTWVGLWKTGKLFRGHIHDATQHLRRWEKLTGVFSAIVGAGGLYGINRMIASVAGQRTSAAGLGISYGEQASFLTNFGRLGNAEEILQGFSEAETDVSKKYALRQYLGHAESGDPAKDFAEGLGRFKEFVDKTPRELLEPMLQARGYDKLGIGREQANIVRGMSREEVAQISRGYKGDLASRLGLADADAKKWTEFSTQMERADREIQTEFAKGAINLTPSLTHLSDSFVKLIDHMLVDGGPIAGFIDRAGKGLDRFAESVDSGEFQRNVSNFVRDCGDSVKLFENFISSAPGGVAVLLGTGLAARYGGGAAVAAGTALARSTALAAAGRGAWSGGKWIAGAVAPAAGAAAVPLGVGALGAAVIPQPLNSGEDERYRQAHPGWVPGNRKRSSFGHPHINHPMPASVFPEVVPAKPGSLSDRSAIWLGKAAPEGTPRNHEYIHLSGGAAGRKDSLGGMQPDFRARLEAMFKDAPAGASVFSGYRSPALQSVLFNRPHRAGYVARPGHSHHGMGDAADVSGDLSWFHAHAAEYGLRFPMMHGKVIEPWHIQSDPSTRVPVPEGATPSRRQAFGHPHGLGHHPATIGRAEKTLTIEDHTGGMVTVVPH